MIMDNPQPTIDGDSTVRVRDDLTAADIDDEIVVYDDRVRRLHRLNPTAAMIWRCLDGSGSLSQIAADIADVYGAPADIVLTDVVSTARHCAREGLLAGFEPPELEEAPPQAEADYTANARVPETPAPCIDRHFQANASEEFSVACGSLILGLRVSTMELARAVRSVLAPALRPGTSVPPNVSIAETAVRAGRPLYYCYRSGYLCYRARSMQEAIAASIRLLESYGQTISGDSTRFHAILAVKDGHATLIAPEGRRHDGLIPRLQRAGWQIYPSPWVVYDPRTSEVVVGGSDIDFHADRLLELPGDSGVWAFPAKGRYRLSAWVALPDGGYDLATPAGRLSDVAAKSPDLRRRAQTVLRAVAELLTRASFQVSAGVDLGSVVRAADSPA